MRIANTVNDSIVDGHGLRFTVFTQGCPHHCPGCHNPGTHDAAGGREATLEGSCLAAQLLWTAPGSGRQRTRKKPRKCRAQPLTGAGSSCKIGKTQEILQGAALSLRPSESNGGAGFPAASLKYRPVRDPHCI